MIEKLRMLSGKRRKPSVSGSHDNDR